MNSVNHKISNPDHIQDLAQKIIRWSKADETEITISVNRSELTRYANNGIHQHIAAENVGVGIRVIKDKRSAQITINRLDEPFLQRALRQVEEMIRRQRPLAGLLPLPTRQSYRRVKGFASTTARALPEDRARMIKRIIQIGKRNKLIMAGAVSTELNDFFLFGSGGIRARFPSTLSQVRVAALNGSRMGFRERSSRNIDDLDPGRLAEEAAADATVGGSPRPLAPGNYPVLLTAKAAADMVEHAAGHFGALAVKEGRSCFSDRLQKRVASELVTISDDVYDGLFPGCPFDGEGMPRTTLKLIDRGILANVAHDRTTAKRIKGNSTGHGLPMPNDHGPMPTHLVVQPGSLSVERMMRTMKRGVLISGFHYVNMVNPHDLTITGMTKGTAFWIENGEVAYPVNTLRFTQSILSALMSVDAVGKESHPHSEWGGVWCVSPALRAQSFQFTSSSDF